MGLVNELGNSINAANASALKDMINLAQAAAGKDVTFNDVALGTSTSSYTYNATNDHWMNGTAEVSDQNLIARLNESRNLGASFGNGVVGDEAATAALATTARNNAANGGQVTSATTIEGVIVSVDKEIQAGGLVELQFKIDQMMAAVQEGIKNTGKVSQTREGAARA